MNTRILLVTVLLGLASAWAASPARADGPDCSLPPADVVACGSPQIACGTHDDDYIALWCGDPNEVVLMAGGLGMEADQWDEGWGAGEACNVDLPYARLLGAAYLIRVVEVSASRFGLLRTVYGDGGAPLLSMGAYWGFAGTYSDDEWEPTCEDEVVARHTCDTDCYVNMHMEGLYRRAVACRGSTIVHETVHEDEGHIDEELCEPDSGSCDTVYGAYNANTAQINYLHDAMLAYRLVLSDAGVGRMVARSNEECAFVDYFSETEQAELDGLAGAVSQRFSFPVSYADLLLQVNTRKFFNYWGCESCDPSRFLFNPQDCEPPSEACNSALNEGNSQKNAEAYLACEEYNDAIADHIADGTLTPELTGQLRSHMLGATHPGRCLVASEEGMRSYCNDEQASAALATDIDECGWLDSVHGVNMNKIYCVKEWCFQKLEESLALGQTGIDEWIEDDPYGCLDYLCGDELCGDERTPEQCVFAFRLELELGNELSYSCGLNGCSAKLEFCLYSYYLEGTWDFGQPYPTGPCMMQFQHCELMSMLASQVLLNLEAVYNPAAIWEWQFDEQFAWSRNPARDFFRFARGTREALGMATSGEEQTRLALAFTATPEMVAQAFRAAPGKFVWLFGREGLRDVLGPMVDSVPMEAITYEELTPEGRIAFRNFMNELDDLAPGEVIEGSMGTFAVR